MPGEKRKQRGGGNNGGAARDAKRRRYDPKQFYRSGEIRGPGIWFTCDRRKEPKAVVEAYDLLNEVADEIYPETSQSGQADANGDDNDEDVEESIEDSIARELASIKPKARESKQKMRFFNVKTNTECLIWIGCSPPCDPVVLTHALVKRLQGGKPARSRHLARMTPVSATAHADLDSLKRIAYATLAPVFAPEGYTEAQRAVDKPIAYRIEPNLRNHSGNLSRDKILAAIGEVVKNLTTPGWQVPPPEAPQAKSESKVGEQTEGQTADQPRSAGPGAGETSGSGNQSEAEEVDTLDVPAQSAGDAEGQKSPEVPVDSSSERTQLPTIRRKAVVNLYSSEYVIMVSALKGVCGISCVQGFDEGKKFNIQTLSGGNQPDPKQEAAKAAKKAAQDAEKEEALAEEAYHRSQAALVGQA